MAKKKHKYDRATNAFLIMYGEWLRINTIECFEDDGSSILPNNSPSPEKLVMKNESWEALSSEAKELIMTIVNAPAEIIDIISTPKRKRITKASIRKYFCKYWRSKFITNETINEVSKWVNQL